MASCHLNSLWSTSVSPARSASTSRYFWIIANTKPGPGRASKSLTFATLLANLHRFTSEGRGIAELSLKICPVRDRYDLEPPKLWDRPHLSDKEDHC